MWRLIVLLAVTTADGRGKKGKHFSTTTEKEYDYDEENIMPRVPDRPPPPLRYYCEHLRPYTPQTTIFKKGKCPYTVEMQWISARTLGIYLYFDPLSGFNRMSAFQVRVDDTRPIGWFHNYSEAVITSCPPGRMNTMYMYNTVVSSHQTAVWHAPNWYDNHTATLFYMIMSFEYRYWRGNLTVPVRKWLPFTDFE